MIALARVSTALRPSRRHRRQDLFGPREGEIFGRVIRRQDLDHRLVLDPHLNDMKWATIAVEAVPSSTLDLNAHQN